MENENFAAFILTHGRPDRVTTYRTLRRLGYTGPIYVVVDNEDKTVDQYREQFGDQVVVFDKLAVSKTFDEADNFSDRRTVVYARNACFDIARSLGIQYFLQLDDDYNVFRYKFDANLVYTTQHTVHNLDRLFDAILDYYKSIPALTIAMGQGGDFIGGGAGQNGKKLWLKRKAMNTFFCDVDRPFKFLGRINEDVNTYVVLGNRGALIFTFFNTMINQAQTQSRSGGMTDIYLNAGTYIKSFYTVMFAPSCVVIAEMGQTDRRLHHMITWSNAVPCLVSESLRKGNA